MRSVRTHLAARVATLMAILAAALALAACGGSDAISDGESQGPTVTMPVEQGNIKATSRSLDVAIAGGGVFSLRDSDNQPVYSRVGRLDVDRDGYLVHAEGWRVAGRATPDASGDDAQALPPLPYTMAGASTSAVRAIFNFDYRKPVVPAEPAFDALDPNTYSDATSLTVYDSNGTAIALTFYIAHVGADEWLIRATANEQLLPQPVARLHFGFDGMPDLIKSPAFDIPAMSDGPNGPTQAVSRITIDWTGSSSFAAQFMVVELTASGYKPGHLVQVEIGIYGHITTRYDNGQQRAAGQLLLARFALTDRLQQVGTSGLRCVRDCAAPIVAPPGELLLGTLVNYALEELP